MGDEMTPGEIRRTFDRVEAAQRATNDRLTDLASKVVPTDLWAAEHRALTDQLRHVERDAAEARERIEKLSSERLATVTREIGEVRKALREHEQEHEDDEAWSRKKILAAVGIAVGAAATLAAAWITAVLAARGVH